MKAKRLTWKEVKALNVRDTVFMDFSGQNGASYVQGVVKMKTGQILKVLTDPDGEEETFFRKNGANKAGTAYLVHKMEQTSEPVAAVKRPQMGVRPAEPGLSEVTKAANQARRMVYVNWLFDKYEPKTPAALDEMLTRLGVDAQAKVSRLLSDEEEDIDIDDPMEEDDEDDDKPASTFHDRDVDVNDEEDEVLSDDEV